MNPPPPPSHPGRAARELQPDDSDKDEDSGHGILPQLPGVIHFLSHAVVTTSGGAQGGVGLS